MNTKRPDYLYQIKNIAFAYKLGAVNIEALRNISLDIEKYSLTTFSGPSGSGKSTLLNILGFIEPLQAGQMHFHDENVVNMKKSHVNQIRKFEIGFIFQQFHLIRRERRKGQ